MSSGSCAVRQDCLIRFERRVARGDRARQSRRGDSQLLGEKAGEADAPELAPIAAFDQSLGGEGRLGEAHAPEREPEQAKIGGSPGQGRILVARQLDGVKFALGPTIATTRSRLRAFGGYEAIENRPADDLLVGRLIAEQGCEVVLLPYAISTVPDYQSLKELFYKRLRWITVGADSVHCS